jgi:hypothetical protein
MADKIIQGVSKLTADSTVNAAASGVVISASAAGTVRLIMADTSVFDTYVNAGPTQLDGFAVRGYASSGTTATITAICTY